MYITSRGMNITTGDPLEQATPYIKALSHLWGWGELTVIAAQNMDYSSPEGIEDRIQGMGFGYKYECDGESYEYQDGYAVGYREGFRDAWEDEDAFGTDEW